MKKHEFVEILLVEDNQDEAELALIALKKSNTSNHITWLKDGEQALDFLFGKGEYEGRDVLQKPKVILLDLNMPKVNGIEVLKKLRNDERTKQIPVTILTSSNEEKDIAKSYELGANSYIVKPVDFDDFLKTIRDIGCYWAVLNQPALES